jgi:hypothetical protein
MVGAFDLLGEEGDRLEIIYIGAGPETDKKTFLDAFEKIK